jgi:hypothetical protein
VPDQQEQEHATPDHKYNDPALTSMEFLRAVMHDRNLPLGQRMDAAIKLLPLETPPVPTYYGEFPLSRTVVLTIRIEPLPSSPGAPEVGFGPRDDVGAAT